MKRNPASPTVIEKFRQQSERQGKYLLVLVGWLALAGAGALVWQFFPILRDQPVWKILGIVWAGLFGVGFVPLLIASFLNNRCPACGKPVGEDFWTARYCQYCGTQLREK
jgi:drug/metabolite transporter (DMT)-like permease